MARGRGRRLRATFPVLRSQPPRPARRPRFSSSRLGRVSGCQGAARGGDTGPVTPPRAPRRRAEPGTPGPRRVASIPGPPAAASRPQLLTAAAATMAETPSKPAMSRVSCALVSWMNTRLPFNKHSLRRRKREK